MMADVAAMIVVIVSGAVKAQFGFFHMTDF